MHIYGIKTCDTCRKARKWLDEQGKSYHWHDLREDGLDAALVRRWLDTLGPEALVNRRSTTWRNLDPAVRDKAMKADSAAAVLLAHPTLVKRPVFEQDGQVLVGFNAAVREVL
jgi:arsenate reductase (glutaredoxin)